MALRMIKLMASTADLFASKADVLVCPANTRGIMGAGLAKEFKRRFPAESADYWKWATGGYIFAGQIQIMSAESRIVFATTKDDWRNKSEIRWIEQICQELVDLADELKWKSAAVPALGCGLGGLDWLLVYGLMVRYLTEAETTFEIYPPK